MGATKKVVYADGLARQRIIAIQSLTATIYSATALIGTYLFLQGHLKAAYLTCMLITQFWRIFSEFLRADDRGNGFISIYQYIHGWLRDFDRSCLHPDIAGNSLTSRFIQRVAHSLESGYNSNMSDSLVRHLSFLSIQIGFNHAKEKGCL